MNGLPSGSDGWDRPTRVIPTESPLADETDPLERSVWTTRCVLGPVWATYFSIRQAGDWSPIHPTYLVGPYLTQWLFQE